MLLQEKLTLELVDEIERCNRLITLDKTAPSKAISAFDRIDFMQIDIDFAKEAIKNNDTIAMIASLQELKTYKL